VLNVRADISLSPFIDSSRPQQGQYAVSLIRATGLFHSPEHRIVSRFTEDIALLASDSGYTSKTQVIFEVPLDVAMLTRIERDRAGGDLKVKLTFSLLLALHTVNGGFRGFYSGRVEDLLFSIPRSVWVDSILPALGYGGLELLEVRYGSGFLASALPKSVEQISAAKKYLLEGDWDKAVMHCRKALELILDSRPSSLPQPAKFRDRVNTFISENLKTIGEAQAKVLAKQMELLWEVSSHSTHPSPTTFQRSDAEFLVRTTMAIVEYFSRLLP